MSVETDPSTLRVNFLDPVASRLARLIAQEGPHPRLGSHDEMLLLRSALMRRPHHTWRLCQRCRDPFDAHAGRRNKSFCDTCLKITPLPEE